MKKIIFSDHAEKRRKQRGFTNIEIEFIIERPSSKKVRSDNRIEILGFIRNRRIKVVYEEEEKHIRIISLI